MYTVISGSGKCYEDKETKKSTHGVNLDGGAFRVGLSESVAFELSPVAVWDKVFQVTMVKGKGIGTGTCGECQGVIRRPAKLQHDEGRRDCGKRSHLGAWTQFPTESWRPS